MQTLTYFIVGTIIIAIGGVVTMSLVTQRRNNRK